MRNSKRLTVQSLASTLHPGPIQPPTTRSLIPLATSQSRRTGSHFADKPQICSMKRPREDQQTALRASPPKRSRRVRTDVLSSTPDSDGATSISSLTSSSIPASSSSDAARDTSSSDFHGPNSPSGDDESSSLSSSSSSSSLAESEDDDEADSSDESLPSAERNNSHHNNITRAVSEDDSDLPTAVQGRPKPRIRRLEADSSILSRVSAFLPQLKSANENLQRAIAAGGARDVILDEVDEEADEEGGQYIEMVRDLSGRERVAPSVFGSFLPSFLRLLLYFARLRHHPTLIDLTIRYSLPI